MILSDRDIRAEIAAGRITIDPFDERCLQPSSVDLHVDSQFRVFANSRYPYIDVREEQPDLTEHSWGSALGYKATFKNELHTIRYGEMGQESRGGKTLEWVGSRGAPFPK